jgi:N6-adenosine-specific RNA methylase IME4
MQESKKLYKTILADPPWDINQKGGYGAIQHYDLMPLERIKAMPIDDLTAEDGHLWLWIPTNIIEIGFEVMRTWGYTPRSILSWIKPGMGLGMYLRTATEHCLLGTKGKAPILFKAQPNWVFAPRQDHSHKPEEQYAIIERCSPGPYLELFARRRQAGWDAWGNEIDSDIDIPGYPVPSSPATRNQIIKEVESD